MYAKETFKKLFIFAVIVFIMLPFMVTFNEGITKVVEGFALYGAIQSYIVPVQAVLVGYLIRPFGIEYIAFRDGMLVNGIPLAITWNCVGWQSLLLFTLSLFIVLVERPYTLFSSLKAVIIGFFGIFLVNLLRITLTVLLAVHLPPLFRIVFHDYLSAIVTILYLFFFWWFAYSFLLEEKIKVPKHC